MTELAVTVDESPGGTIVAVQGKIMYDTYEPLDRVLKEFAAAVAPRIVLDLHGVGLCDSSGLQLILDTHRHAVASGGWLRLCRPRPIVQRVLEITNLTTLLPTYDSVDAAVSDSGSPGSARFSGEDPPNDG